MKSGLASVAPPADESQRRQYEEWLAETQQLLQMQQRLLEDQIITHRKTKKSLSAKQRTARKAGRAFAEEDAAQLRHVTELQGAVQKQLEQVRLHHLHHLQQHTSALVPSDLHLDGPERKHSIDCQAFSFNLRCLTEIFHLYTDVAEGSGQKQIIINYMDLCL